VDGLMEVTKRAIAERPRMDLLRWLEGSGLRRRGAVRSGPTRDGRALSMATLRDNLVASALAERQASRDLADGRQRRIAVADRVTDLVPAEGGSGTSARVYAENARIESLDGGVLVSSEEPRPARLVFVDVPLAGHVTVAADLSAWDGVECVARLVVLDQMTGTAIAQHEGTIGAHEAAAIRVDLNPTHGFACVVVEAGNAHTRGGSHAQLLLSTLTVA